MHNGHFRLIFSKITVFLDQKLSKMPTVCPNLTSWRSNQEWRSKCADTVCYGWMLSILSECVLHWSQKIIKIWLIILRIYFMWEKEAFKKFIPKILAIFQVVAQTTIKMMHCNLFEKKNCQPFLHLNIQNILSAYH